MPRTVTGTTSRRWSGWLGPSSPTTSPSRTTPSYAKRKKTFSIAKLWINHLFYCVLRRFCRYLTTVSSSQHSFPENFAAISDSVAWQNKQNKCKKISVCKKLYIIYLWISKKYNINEFGRAEGNLACVFLLANDSTDYFCMHIWPYAFAIWR